MNQQKGFFSRGVLVVLWLMLVLIMPVTGHAATFTVNSTVDAPDAAINGICQTAAGVCSLRAAVQEANASVGVADTINLPAGTFTLTVAGAGEDAAATGDLDIGDGVGASSLTITGQGQTLTIIDGNNADRVFETIINGTSLTISLVTMRNGNSLALAGGCILVGGNTSLALTNAVVTGCTAAQGGGGIDNSGSLTMNVVAATNNTAQGINNGAAGTIIWTDGEVSGATDRGINNSGTMTLTNVTLSGNTTAGNGGGIDNGGTVTLQNVTISNNTSTTPLNIGGLRNDGTASLRNTIISGNLPANCGGAVALTSLGNNIDNGNTCLFTGPGDLPNTDPLLGALALNGGELRTHATSTIASPAIDTGTATGCPATDARGLGFVRPVDGNPVFGGPVTAVCDIGAFEFRPQTIVVAPASINFGSVTVGLTSSQTVTVENVGDGDLVVGVVHAGDLVPPFFITNDLCTGKTLTFTRICTLAVQFSPTATAPFADEFHIPSNDPTKPLHDSLPFAVIGTGVAGAVPNISVTDSIAPNTDLLAAFGGVTVGSTGIATITVTNTGNANIVFTSIAVNNPLAPPFSKTNDTCSGATIAPNATCTMNVHFAPTANAASVDSFDITSNDPGTPIITFNLSGSGVSATGNNPPAVPALVSPANGAVVSGTTVTFTWTKSVDPDGDAVTHRFHNCIDPTFAAAGCGPVNVASAPTSGLAFAGLGSLGAGIIMIGFVMGSGLKRSRKALLMIVTVFLTGTLFMACSSGDDGAAPVPPAEQMSNTVTGLTPGTTYYWKVVADDGKDGISTSEVRSYTTQ